MKIYGVYIFSLPILLMTVRICVVYIIMFIIMKYESLATV